MTTDLDDLRVTDRDPQHMIDRDGLLVPGQRISGTTAEHSSAPGRGPYHPRHPPLSRNATTTRNRDHASHAQNNTVARPATSGRSPVSYWTSTTPGLQSTAGFRAHACDATAAWTQQPNAASSAVTRGSRSRPTSRARHPPGSDRAQRSTSSSIFRYTASIAGRARSTTGIPPAASRCTDRRHRRHHHQRAAWNKPAELRLQISTSPAPPPHPPYSAS